jgi:glutathione S-transferase
MALKPISVFVDMMSQPSRTVVWFCKLTNIPHEVKLIQISKGEHKKPEYLRVHPLGKVPAIEDLNTNLCLFESHAILRYLAQQYHAPEHYYPSNNFVLRAKIDQYLDWHHSNTRASLARYFQVKFLMPRTGKSVEPKVAEKTTSDLETTLDQLENIWLKDHRFLAGDKISIADLSCYGEIANLYPTKYDLKKRPKLANWISELEKLPHYDEVHSILKKVMARL